MKIRPFDGFNTVQLASSIAATNEGIIALAPAKEEAIKTAKKGAALVNKSARRIVVINRKIGELETERAEHAAFIEQASPAVLELQTWAEKLKAEFKMQKSVLRELEKSLAAAESVNVQAVKAQTRPKEKPVTVRPENSTAHPITNQAALERRAALAREHAAALARLAALTNG